MKKIFAIAMLFAAVSMVSCGGNGSKKADKAEEACCEKTECCEKAEGCCEKGEGCCQKAEGEACCEACAEAAAESAE